MPILNYTTSIAAEKTAGEIQLKLVKGDASAVMCEYDVAGMLTHISFRLQTPHGLINFRLPGNTTGVLKAMESSPKVPKSKLTEEQASKVA